MGAQVRARRCSIRSLSERRARSSAVFWHPNAERYGRSPNLPGVLPLLLPTVVTRSKARRFRSHAIPTARRLSKLGQAWSAAEDPGQRVAAAVEGREAESGVRLRSI